MTQTALESLKFRQLVKEEARVRQQFHIWPQTTTCLITDDDESNLGEWLSSVRARRRLQMETFFLALHLVDCCCLASTKKSTTTTTMAEWGCVCLWVASKQTETEPLDMKDIISDSNGVCSSPQQLTGLELAVLHHAGFQLDIPTAWAFRNVYHAHNSNQGPDVRSLADYLLLVAAPHNHSRFAAPLLALSSLAAACRLCHGISESLDTGGEMGRCVATIIDQATRYGRQCTPGTLYLAYLANGEDAERLLREINCSRHKL